MRRLLPPALDLVIVLIFSLTGRMSHAQALTLGGWAATAWPFLVACLVAWGVVTLLEAEGGRLKAALIIWLVTVLGGMALRVAAGGTAALPFILVATGMLGAAFFGWRLIAMVFRHRASRADTKAAA